jgi:hypothetical protein
VVLELLMLAGQRAVATGLLQTVNLTQSPYWRASARSVRHILRYPSLASLLSRLMTSVSPVQEWLRSISQAELPIKWGWYTPYGRSIPPTEWTGQKFLSPVMNLPSDLDKGDGERLSQIRRRQRDRE